MIDPNRQIFAKRLYRQDTQMVDGELLVKDLIKTGKDLSKVLIIDNIPENFRRQPDNGIFINTWTG